MKIVQLITGSTSFGGAEAHVRDLALGLIARGHECVVLVGAPKALLTRQLRDLGVPVVIIPALRKPIHPLLDPISLVQVLSALRSIKPDILATHTAKAGFIGRIAAALLGIPGFFTPHGLSFIDRATSQPIRFRLALERLALSLGATFIAVCDAERRLALQLLPLSPDSIVTIHNGLPDRVPTPRQPHPSIIITMVARFDLQKDHATLFKALSTLTDLDWQLRLAGSGPRLQAAKHLAEDYGLTPRIHFLEECADTPALLAASDIFVLISNWEAFPISILEAMREGLPILATDIGGVHEAIHDGVNGFLIPPQDSNRIAHCLRQLVCSADLRQAMGSESRHTFSERFVAPLMLDKTETVYAAALSGPIRRTDPNQLGTAPHAPNSTDRPFFSQEHDHGISSPSRNSSQ
jgi:glycosyltransferase involved in cell wall biosynthesis